MNFKSVNREWVKNAAIIFLAVLLVLTFFSNTIMNRTLPEAATAYVTSGTITAKVRGSGTVAANGKHEVKADQTRTIRAVMVKAGQEVNTGDVLFVLGEGDSTELEAAKENLRQLQVSYRRAAVSMPTINYEQYEYTLNQAELALLNAQDAENKVYNSIGNIEESDGAKALKKGVTEAEEALKKANKDYTDFSADSATRDPLVKAIDDAQAILDATDIGTGELPSAAWTKANDDLKAAEKALEDYDSKGDTLYNAVIAAEAVRDERQKAYESYIYPPALQTAIAAREAAEKDYYAALYALEDKKTADNQSMSLASIELQSIAEQISLQQDKIKELAGEEGNEVTANVSGIIDSIGCTAGDTVTKDSVLCSIEVPDMGHTLSFSVTNDQAQRLRVGDSATVSNYYFGSEIVATLATIRNDPKNPQSNKLLTFDVTGNVTTGAELTISVGQKSANYDIIIPNSSIRSDTNGSFVLMVEAKNSPLGNRYIAKRVSVEVLASDDLNSAVTAELNNGDYVITTTSSPVKAGDQVRMADSAT